MYDELVKRLRDYAAARKGEIAELTAGAAGAIEELKKDLERSKEYETFWNKEAEEAVRRFQVAVANKPRWIPVTERLPEDGSDILEVQSYCGEVRIVPVNYDRGVWFDCAYNRAAEHITHWQPLPEPPKGVMRDA